MKLRDRFAELARKYKHAWVFLYILIYMPWFMWLEKHVTTHYHVIQIRLDEHIPFIEYFIIPYLMWFLFIAVVFLYFFFTDVKGFYKLAAFMFTGMTVFLIISTVFPNGQDLRPVIFERDNIFVDMVRALYRTDTCTNVFPSLHVFNSLSVCAAIADSEALKKHRGVCIGAYVLAGLIILATMFLKQHSVLDGLAAVVLSIVLYFFIYQPEMTKASAKAAKGTASASAKHASREISLFFTMVTRLLFCPHHSTTEREKQPSAAFCNGFVTTKTGAPLRGRPQKNPYFSSQMGSFSIQRPYSSL